MQRSGLRIGSLFSGYGGLDQACEAAFGAETRWVSDIDPSACKILAHRYPDLPNHGDITKIDWTAVEPVDILTGGYPCQPFSHAGLRGGTNDERHLWPFVVEAMSALRPRFGLFENVRGHLSLGFDQVLRDLAILGYETRWCVLRAADVGAPHGRARIFILAVDRHVRSGSDRRGGLHRNSGVGRLLSGAPQDRDDRQGPARAAEDAPGVRRHLGLGSEGSGPSTRVACVEVDGTCCGDCDRVRQPVAGCEAGVSADRSSVSVDGRLFAETAEWALDVDGFDACEGCGAADANPGSEPRRARPGTGATSCDDPAGDSSVGLLVGGGGRPIRSGGVRGSLPDVGADGGRADVRDPDGFVYDADLVLAAADTSSERHGRGEDRREVGRVDGGAEGEARQRERARAKSGDRGAEVAADADSIGRSLDAKLHSDSASDSADRSSRRRHADGRSGAAAGRDANGSHEVVADAERFGLEEGRRPSGRDAELAGADDGLGSLPQVAWGAYEPAISRWERAVGRVAPAPTETSSKAAQRLSPAFVEWMMGLPGGWVTDVPDLNRNAQLKALGNGVVPQQAYAAISRMLMAA